MVCLVRSSGLPVGSLPISIPTMRPMTLPILSLTTRCKTDSRCKTTCTASNTSKFLNLILQSFKVGCIYAD
ncbi:hypothetical protein PISMIDRAFT_574752 [Pisolithus microcarpus 441]|uniref:Uncharacterized protein n=1 Tax=Pisolithus microcarpus 441 TaxID=765257 RepID=A0A0C9YK84_9AGAM|nr:hypothetical protein PISMIDRAFT_574752 [Pisolithus microcarpus 441]